MLSCFLATSSFKKKHSIEVRIILDYSIKTFKFAFEASVFFILFKYGLNFCPNIRDSYKFISVLKYVLL
jgi:hypothetical protein